MQRGVVIDFGFEGFFPFLKIYEGRLQDFLCLFSEKEKKKHHLNILDFLLYVTIQYVTITGEGLVVLYAIIFI